MRTLYTYDTLGNLLRVEQRGGTTDSTQWRVRTFTYNSLSQLLTATNPESGIINYTYDADGELLMKNSPAPNILPPSTTTQTVSYCYDELHRVTKRDYQPHTYSPPACPITAPVVSYVYDSGTNAKGHLVSMTDQAGTATYAYDILGRMVTETRPIAGVTKSISYTYQLGGGLKTLTYPSGRVVTYTPDTAGQLVSAVDGNGTNYVSSATYNPDGSTNSLLHGSTPALNSGFQYNPRLQLCRITTLTSGTLPTSCADSQHIGNVMDRGYNFNYGAGDNGNVMAITNYRDTNRSQAFTYDALNRLTSGWSSAGTGNYSWGENYAIDAWGNLQISPMQNKAHGGNFTLSATVQNQSSGLGFDIAGNLTNYTAPGQYVYDPENRLLSIAGMTFTYDGNGERVLKSQTVGGAAVKRYWSMGGNTLAEADGSGNLTAEYIYFGGQRIARIDLPASSVHYYLSDHLNSTSMVVSASGTIEEESDYSSFGTEYPITGSGVNRYKFTGKERDSESQVDYFGARYYSNALGRFITSDWSKKPVPVPYADLDDPQTLNQYGYGRNNPLSHADVDGHFWQELFNKIRYHVWTDNAHLESALQKEAQRRLDDLKKRGVTINGRPAADVLKGKSNTQIYDAYDTINSGLRIQKMMDDVQKGAAPPIVPGQEVPVRDITGKIHGDLPDHVPDSWTKGEMEEAAEELRESIKARNAEQMKYGEEGGHRERIRQEEQLLRQIEKKLSGS
jgi:RHS repeat-associated protein